MQITQNEIRLFRGDDKLDDIEFMIFDGLMPF